MNKYAFAFVLMLVATRSYAETPAAPAPTGLWRVADGTAVVRIAHCGAALCGVIAAAPPPEPGKPSAIGKKILIDMRRRDESWRGRIFNLEDGKIYDGEIALKSADRLKITGCLPGGGACGGEVWRREPASR
jgi:uncharacterized protein (DUF2147 family)